MSTDAGASYAPGTWVAAAGPGCWLLADAPVTDPAVVAFVTLMAGGVDGPGLLAALAASGLVALDSFAVVVGGEPGLAIARGGAHVEIVDESGDVWTVDAEEAWTWVEAHLPQQAQTVTLAAGPDALAAAGAADQLAFDGEPVGADLLVVDRTPQPEPAEVEGDVVEGDVVEGDVVELAAWADSGTDPEPPRPSGLPPRPPSPPGSPPVAPAPSPGLPARPAVPPPVTYAPGPEVDPTPTDRLRLGGRREGREDRGAHPADRSSRPRRAAADGAVPLRSPEPARAGRLPPVREQDHRAAGDAASPPPMGVLELASGETVPVDRGVLVGRTPSWPGAPGDRPHLVQLTSPLGDISRNHVEVTLRGWDVVAVDLGSMNGTRITGADGDEREPAAGEAVVLGDGDVLTIAEGVELRYRREP